MCVCVCMCDWVCVCVFVCVREETRERDRSQGDIMGTTRAFFRRFTVLSSANKYNKAQIFTCFLTMPFCISPVVVVVYVMMVCLVSLATSSSSSATRPLRKDEQVLKQLRNSLL